MYARICISRWMALYACMYVRMAAYVYLSVYVLMTVWFACQVAWFLSRRHGRESELAAHVAHTALDTRQTRVPGVDP